MEPCLIVDDLKVIRMVARKRGTKRMEELTSVLRTKRAEKLSRDVTEAMITNAFFFFRDIRPFDLLRNVTLPELLKN